MRCKVRVRGLGGRGAVPTRLLATGAMSNAGRGEGYFRQTTVSEGMRQNIEAAASACLSACPNPDLFPAMLAIHQPQGEESLLELTIGRVNAT